MENRIILKKREESGILNGYQWIFSNEIGKTEGSPQNGDIISIYSSSLQFLGQGFYNKNSLITVRFLTSSKSEITKDFFKNRIISSLNLRKIIYPSTDIYRLVFSESDLLPGLIIDRFNEGFVIQTFSIGMEKWISVLTEILVEIFQPSFIIERNESQLRQLEGLELKSSVLYGEPHPMELVIDDIKYSADLEKGQKTGFFLDQRENRKYVRKYLKDKSVLDSFCNEGGFALSAALSGAKEILGIDISEYAVQKAKENALSNGLSGKCTFEQNDVFESLKQYAEKSIKFDAVILDPPSFTKSKKNIPIAIKGYKRINSLAIEIINDGGILISSSCSHHISSDDFLNIIHESAAKEGCQVKMLEFHSAAPDHPILLSMPETKYLKFGIFQILK